MKNKLLKETAKFLLTVLLTSALAAGLYVLTRGMYLLGVPKIDEVQRVTISYPDAADEIKEISDGRQIELAVKLTGFLKYSLFEKADAAQDPLITVTYFLDNGQSVSVSANRDTVWWKGRAYALKEKEMFVNLTEGIFF